jgi:LAGLIDADG DNA endonuclease family protein
MMRSMKTAVASDNPQGVRLRAIGGEPDDQQERLIKAGWVQGFVDGEGCFSIGFIRLKAGESRGLRGGIQVFPEFAVTQGAKSIRSLSELQTFFGVGQVHRNGRTDDHNEDVYRYVVRRREDLLHIIIPFFRRHPLRTSKREDFEKFDRCMTLIERGRHLSRDGLLEIVGIAENMNRQKPRPDLIRILRDQTPDELH